MLVVFFKQKTAYEMRISDWSSDVCSSDLYANRRHAFGKPLVDHEGVGFMLAENLIDIKQAELLIDWCAGVLDTGSLGTAESSMAQVAVSEALMRVADRCEQEMGGTGDRKGVVSGKSGSGRVDTGGCLIITKTKNEIY